MGSVDMGQLDLGPVDLPPLKFALTYAHQITLKEMRNVKFGFYIWLEERHGLVKCVSVIAFPIKEDVTFQTSYKNI